VTTTVTYPCSRPKEFVSLGADGAEDREVHAFLRRMNANHRLGSGSGRALLREVGKRVEELADGAVPKVFDWMVSTRTRPSSEHDLPFVPATFSGIELNVAITALGRSRRRRGALPPSA
jgi:hypothetical protein